MTNHGGGGASWFRPCRHGYHRPPRFPKGSRRRRRRSPPAVAARPAPRAPSATIFDPRRDDGCPRATPRCAPPAGRMHAFIVSRTSRAPPTRFGRDQARVDTADGGRGVTPTHPFLAGSCLVVQAAGRRDHRRRRPGRALSLPPSRRYRAPGVAARFRLPRRRHAPWVSPVSPLSPCGFRAGLPHAASRWADGARRCGLRPDRLPATAPLRLSSPVLRPFLARQESLVAPSSAALRPRAVRVDRLPA